LKCPERLFVDGRGLAELGRALRGVRSDTFPSPPSELRGLGVETGDDRALRRPALPATFAEPEPPPATTWRLTAPLSAPRWNTGVGPTAPARRVLAPNHDMLLCGRLRAPR
jgi:hypothetical protein